MTDQVMAPPPPPSSDELAALAARHGLSASTRRQPVGDYLRELWARRDFAVALASGRKDSQYRDTILGRLWQVLAPILNAIVYYFIFGVLLQTSKGVENFPAFLMIGVFTFTFTSRCVTGGTRAIANNRGLIREIHFPRAVLPLSAIVQEVQQQLVSLGILVVIVFMTGEPLTWKFLLMIPVVGLHTVFNTGLCMMIARWSAASRDVAQLIPFVLQTWRYMSGVMFSIPVFTQGLPHWVQTMLYANPLTQYVELMRHSMMATYPAPPMWLWVGAVVWAIVFVVGGFWIFYRAEETYSRG